MKPSTEDVKSLLSPEAEARAAAAIERAKAATAAERLAAATPLPGPLREAFRLPAGIKVGPYTVRPVYDGDIELLYAWGHPFAAWIIAQLAGQPCAEFVPRGPDAWVLYWLFTHPVEVAESVMEDPQGRERAYREARLEFRRVTLAQGLALFDAVVRQLGVLVEVGQQYTSGSSGTGDQQQRAIERVDPTLPAPR